MTSTFYQDEENILKAYCSIQTCNKRGRTQPQSACYLANLCPSGHSSPQGPMPIPSFMLLSAWRTSPCCWQYSCGLAVVLFLSFLLAFFRVSRWPSLPLGEMPIGFSWQSRPNDSLWLGWTGASSSTPGRTPSAQKPQLRVVPSPKWAIFPVFSPDTPHPSIHLLVLFKARRSQDLGIAHVIARFK